MGLHMPRNKKDQYNENIDLLPTSDGSNEEEKIIITVVDDYLNIIRRYSVNSEEEARKEGASQGLYGWQRQYNLDLDGFIE